MVQVEFFGVPRVSVGQARVEVKDVATLGQLLATLAKLFPALIDGILTGPKDAPALHPAYVMAINGEQFTNDQASELNPGDSVLIMAASAGG